MPSSAAPPTVGGGFVVGNFGIAAQVSQQDDVRLRLLVNPPYLSTWLEDFGMVRIYARTSDGTRRLDPVQVSRVYPVYDGKFVVENGLSVSISISAPLSQTPEPNFLPAVVIDVATTTEAEWRGEIVLEFVTSRALGAVEVTHREGQVAVTSEHAVAGLSSNARVHVDVDEQSVAFTVGLDPSDSNAQMTFVLGAYDSAGRYAAQHPHPGALLEDVMNRSIALVAGTKEFADMLPVTGDRVIDEYIRWYTSAAILLTKGLRTGEVISMGYVELNPRDSYWATGTHLLFWPALERQMIYEIAEGQLPDGRIPSTVLPIINRGDELDVSSYFVLRVARFFRWHRDTDLLAAAWPAVTRAIGYLESRDLDGVRVPRQTSYWADWKDVPGVDGRAYAPHFALLWIATLAEAVEMARALDDEIARGRYEKLQHAALEFVNRPFAEGGMWGGANYVDRWDDGRRTNYVLQDQTVGAVFGVIPPDRLRTLHEQLLLSETPYGVAETYPFIENFEQPHGEGGNYHNGGIWPFMNWIDVTGRYMAGRGLDAERIIHKVGHADLVAEGDFQPGEFLNADTGQNRGSSIQAWSGGLISAIYQGAFGVERISDAEYAIRVRIPSDRDFMTKIVLPAGVGELRSSDGALSWTPEEGLEAIVTLHDERDACSPGETGGNHSA